MCHLAYLEENFFKPNDFTYEKLLLHWQSNALVTSQFRYSCALDAPLNSVPQRENKKGKYTNHTALPFETRCGYNQLSGENDIIAEREQNH